MSVTVIRVKMVGLVWMVSTHFRVRVHRNIQALHVHKVGFVIQIYLFYDFFQNGSVQGKMGPVNINS